MKTLLFVQASERATSNFSYYRAMERHGDVEVVPLSSEQQANLARTLEPFDLHAYQRVVLFLRFKKEIKQVRFIRTIPNLVILEHDAFQNYIEDKYRGKFSRHYRALPWARVLSSGVTVSRKLRSEGVDAVFVRKGYDDTLLLNQGRERSIELGFLGSTASKTYNARREFLEQLAQREPLLVKRTRSGEEYRDTLNAIRFFISADVEFGEYMVKNFEALACGCVLFAWDQGEEENRGLGMVDMENCVLYRSLDDLQAKLAALRRDSGLADRIAAAGQALAERDFGYDKVARDFLAALEPPLRKPLVSRRLLRKQYGYQEP